METSRSNRALVENTTIKLTAKKPDRKVGIAIKKTSATSDVDDFKCTPIFKNIQKVFEKEGPKFVKKFNGILAFEVKDGPNGKTCRWVVDGKNGNGCVELNAKNKADCTVLMKDNDLADLLLGKMNANTAYFSGKMKISGKLNLAMKMQTLMPGKAKL